MRRLRQLRGLMKYPEKESSTVEFKRDLPTKNQIIKTVIGFCNMYGGKLIVGVDDSGEIIGLPEEKIDQLMEDLHRSIFASCSPTVIPSIHMQRIDNKILLIIEVSEGMTKPYFLASVGVDDATYLRIGSQTVKANQAMIHELKWQSFGKYPDEMPVHAAKHDDIDYEGFEKFLLLRRESLDDIPIEDMLYHYTILTKEHMRSYPTLGGMMLFGKEPQRFFSEAFIICTHFLGTSGRDVVATRDCTGRLAEQYRDCISFILSRLNRQFVIEGTGPRKETLEMPEKAIREVVINALVHRNYLIPGPIRVSIYDDRLEVFSPGTFPGPIQLDHLLIGVTYIRNSVITRAFREMGHIEKFGSGLITLFNSYEEWGLARPLVHEGPGFVKCILPRPTVSAGVMGVEGEEEKLLQFFFLRTEVKTQDVMSYLSVSRATANRYLSSLLQKHLIRKHGQGPSTYYSKNL